MPIAPPRHRPHGQLPRAEAERRRKAAVEQRRPSALERGYTAEWHRAAKAFLARPENRFCVCGCGGVATVVDHKIAHRGDRNLFWNPSNWQPMTLACNSAKAAREEGGFGNPMPLARPR
jgi:5-methylcytosine-specific restriction protein A